MRSLSIRNQVTGPLFASALAVCVVANSLPAADLDRQPLEVPNSTATDQADMKKYVEIIEHTDAKFEMTPIPGANLRWEAPTPKPIATKVKALSMKLRSRRFG